LEDFDATARAVVEQFEKTMGPQGKAKAKPKPKGLGKAKAKSAPEPLTSADVDRAFELKLKDWPNACEHLTHCAAEALLRVRLYRRCRGLSGAGVAGRT
jgi:hypothetical protein